MIDLGLHIRFALRANDIERRAALRDGKPAPDPLPVVKLFNPLGAATWLVTEMAPDRDSMFGLADLGFGCPELGSFSLAEISRVRLPFGLRIECDRTFEPMVALSVWAEWSREAGSILCAEAMLRRAANRPGSPPIPPS